MAETYLEVEARIQSAYEALLNAEKPNIAATAHEFDVPLSPLRGRWKGPLTIQSLKRYTSNLQDQDPVSPSFKKQLDRFIKGSLVQATAGVHAFEELEHTKAAEMAQANRQNRSRRFVQQGGVIYAHQAWAAVVKRAEDDAQEKLEKAQRQLEHLKTAAIKERKKKWRAIFKDLKQAIKQWERRLKHQR